METFMKAASSFITISPKMALVVVIITGSCLFATEEMRKLIGVNELVKEYYSIIGVFFLISSSISVVNGVVYCGGFIKKKWSNFNYKRKREKLLCNLEGYELAIVKMLYDKTNHTNLLDSNDGSVNYLVTCQVICRTSTISANYDREHIYFHYALNPWVIKYIKNNEKMKRKLDAIIIAKQEATIY